METPSDTPKVEKIRALNDQLRQTFSPEHGHVLITRGIHSLEQDTLLEVILAVQVFDDFTPDNDPYGEHDFGSLTVQGHKVFWKIDSYDPTMTYGSEDPADPDKTCRVLTVMLAEEY